MSLTGWRFPRLNGCIDFVYLRMDDWLAERFPAEGTGDGSSRVAETPITPPMATDISCPTCDSELLIQGDEAIGDEVHCGYCGGVYKVIAKDVERLEVEEDF